jgi:putative DNA methylase
LTYSFVPLVIALEITWDILQGLIVAFRKGDVPVALGYVGRHGEGKEDLVKDLLEAWTAEMHNEDLRKEGRALLFGLK